MYKISFNILALFFFLSISTLVTAQKCGHLNFSNLIKLMPQTREADSELEAYQELLVQKGEEMAARWQKDAEAFTGAVQNGTLTPVEQQTREAELQERQQEIIGYEQKVQNLVAQKREELLIPIMKMAEEAIKKVAEENGYEAVLDTSIFNVVLFAIDSKDLMPLVKAKLGLE